MSRENEGRMKVAYFGLSAHSSEKRHTICRKLDYLAPEMQYCYPDEYGYRTCSCKMSTYPSYDVLKSVREKLYNPLWAFHE
ncbi:hypothetical protein C5167_044138 [Papaver somniferum]|uniref:Uncharacterized protein n=1 Tax=Papaver somniferum TaxID=3469 RepID=A0A4Y7L8M6_PAPSO|nr:hypothetical protein C5167_044138 [Papaver somniferum]